MIKKILLILAIVVAVIAYSDSKNQTIQPVSIETFPPAKVEIKADRFSFRCDGRQHCSQMTSYEEAKFFLDNCPNTKMDGDKDGIPCERQF